MATIDELFGMEGLTLDESEHEWIDVVDPDSDYAVVDVSQYKDPLVIKIDHDGRIASDISAQLLHRGQVNSQYIVFERERYFDGVDLLTKELGIGYERPDGAFGRDVAVNVQKTGDGEGALIRYGWIVPLEATAVTGNLRLASYIVGKDGDNYILTDLFTTLVINDSVIPTDISEANPPSWYAGFVANITALNAEAKGYAQTAEAKSMQVETVLSDYVPLVSYVSELHIYDSEWEMGTIQFNVSNANFGKDASSSTTIRSQKHIVNPNSTLIFLGEQILNDGTKDLKRPCFAIFYDQNGDAVEINGEGRLQFQNLNYKITVPNNAYWVRFVYGFGSGWKMKNASGELVDATVANYGLEKLAADFKVDPYSKCRHDIMAMEDDIVDSVKDQLGNVVETNTLSSLKYKGIPNTLTDMNDLLTFGIYNITYSVASKAANTPNGSESGIAVIIHNPSDSNDPSVADLVNTVTQFYIGVEGGTLYVRSRKASTKEWGEWVTYVRMSDLDAYAKHSELQVVKDTYRTSLGALMDIAETYFNAAYSAPNTLLYDGTYGMWVDKLHRDGSQVNSIVCSQFVQSCLAAITYQNSRYVKGENGINERLPWGWMSDGSGRYRYEPKPSGLPSDWSTESLAIQRNYNDYMIAAEQARYFDNKGLLYAFNPKFKESLKAGDIIFTDDPDKSEATYYKKIGHVAIVISTSNHGYSVMESWTTPPTVVDFTHEIGVRVMSHPWSYINPAEGGSNAYFVKSEQVIGAQKHICSLVAEVSGEYSIGVNASTGNLTGEVVSVPASNVIGLSNLPMGFYTITADCIASSDITELHAYLLNGGSYQKDITDEQGNPTTVDIPYRSSCDLSIKCGKLKGIIYNQKGTVTRLYIGMTNAPYNQNAVCNISNLRIYRGYYPY